MGYPTSVFSPAVRSNGQTIDAAHVNDIQSEITAVENALLGTITHSVNISGASTLATLQAAASTFTVRPVTPPPHAALVFLETDAVTGSSSFSTIAFTGQQILTNSSMHSTGTNPERLTPQSTGVYAITAQVRATSTQAGVLGLHLTDSTEDIGEVRYATSSRGTFMQIHAYKRFDVLGSYVTCRLETVSGVSTNTISTGANGVSETWFAMHKL